MSSKERVIWVLKCAVETVGRVGWISRASSSLAVGDDVEICVTFGLDRSGSGANTGKPVVVRPSLVGEDEGRTGPNASLSLSGPPFAGDEDTKSSRCLFLLGDSSGLVGEGELDSKGRFW